MSNYFPFYTDKDAFEIVPHMCIKNGDNIPGISPHVGRFGVGYNPNENWGINFDIEAD